MSKLKATLAIAALATGSWVIAADDPAHERHEIMEGVRDAAKPVGLMLRGEEDYDPFSVSVSLQVFADAAATFGDLFPAGSEGGEAAPAIWTDRAGFDAALVEWQTRITAAQQANPQTLDEAKPIVGPVFGACKNCHDSYRIEDE